MLVSAFWRVGRFDKPIGTALILFPCWWGLAYIQGLAIDVKLMLLFTIGALAMRAAGCILNDYFDRDIDRQVERTKNRPLASGEITTIQAFFLFIILCIIGLMVLLQLPTRCWPIGAASAILLIIYPKAKRFTNYPQAVLGLAFNIGFPIAVAIFTPQWYTAGVLAAYIAGICWTIAYDTVYAFQDIKDDRHLGIGSTALTFGKYAKKIVGALYGLMAGFLSLSCYLAHSSMLPYLFFAAAAIFAIQKLITLDITDVQQCRDFFVSNQWVGLIVFIGFLLR